MEHTRQNGLDTLRGIALLHMIAYHASWDLVYIFGFNWSWYRSFGAYLWQQAICWTFILLSGFCFHLGRRRFRRGLLTFGGGVLVSAVTLFWMPSNRVICGILTLLGSATLLTAVLDSFLRRIPARAGVVGSFTLFLLCYDINDGFLGFMGSHLCALPSKLYQNVLTACLGFPPSGFFSTDYFPLLPWIFLFLTGYFLYYLRQGTPWNLHLPLLTVMGRHSLWIYLCHQPVIYAILWILNELTKQILMT